MKGRWALALLIFLATCSLSAFAGSPTIGVLDPTCNTGSKTDYDYLITGSKQADINFSNFTAVNGGGTFTFCNQTTTTWTKVDFATTNFNSAFGQGTWVFDSGGLILSQSTSATSPILCSVGTPTAEAFLNCSVTITSNEFLMSFYGTTSPGTKPPVGGVPQNQTMTVDLNTYIDSVCTSTPCGDWKDSNGDPITFSGGANLSGPLAAPVPEPTSLVLLGTGLSGLLLSRRKNKRR